METAVQLEPIVRRKSKLPIIVGVAAGVLLCCCLLGVGVYALLGEDLFKGGDVYAGRADEILLEDTLNLIGLYEEGQLGCADLSLLGGQILLAPDPAGDGSWQETWRVDACGETHLYAITFTPTAGGGTDIEVMPAAQ
jgi:hypothetical protein